MVPTPKELGVEDAIVSVVLWLKLAVEALGALVIAIGVVAAGARFARSFVPPPIDDYNKIRLTLARYLALALEFQLGADILSTAVTPTWDQLGKLGVVAVIRTALNYFLTREMREEREGIATDAVGGSSTDRD